MKKSTAQDKTEQKGLANPFPGLRPFTPEESDLFFGREGQSEEILTKLRKNRFVTVIGASGSGKSSLIYCGIIPRMMSEDSNESWRVISLRPGNDPIGNLVSAFSGENASEKSRNKMESELRSNDSGLDSAVASLKLKQNEKVLLLVDQFEELFRFKDAQRAGAFTSDSMQFVNLLVSALTKSQSGMHVILTMRSDFIGECAYFQGLTSLINSSNYLVPHMARDNYVRAITGPVEYAGAQIDEELVNRLLDEIGSRIDQLPVLQHAMMRTWNHWQLIGHKDIPISITDYDSVGQMSEAMSRHADEAFEELDSRGKVICEVIFKTISEKGNDNKGVRHPTKVETIAAIARCSNEELYNVINVYRLSGRSFLTPGPGVDLSPETVIDVSHESLMRVWDRLAIWVEEEAASVQMYLRLSEASELFQAGKTSLWRPPDLQLAINWREDNQPTLTWAERYNPAFERAKVYLETSEKEYLAEEENKIKAQKRQLRRSRITAIILGTAAIISVLFMLYAFVQQIEAEKNRIEAEANKELAEEQTIVAENNAEIAKVNATEANLQRERAQDNEAQAVYNAAVADTAKLRAIAGEQSAATEAKRANESAEEARLNEQEAIRQKAIADEQTEIATSRRMVSIGKTMAVKSVQSSGQGDLQGLLAYQAYIFNKRYGGKENDADIYLGLYHVGKTYDGSNYRQLNGHTGAVRSISFMPEENKFFTSGSDGKVISWNLANGTPQIIFEDDQIMDIIITSQDGNLLACGSDKAEIRIFPADGAGMSFVLNGHSAKIKSLVFTPDNKYLFSSAIDGSLLKWDLDSKEYTELINEGGIANSLDVSPSGIYLAAAESNGEVQIWDIQTSEKLNTINSEKGLVNVVRFSEDGTLAVGYENGDVDLWDIESTTITAEINGHNATVTDIRFNTKSKQMASSGLDGYVKLWNLDDLAEPPISLVDNGGMVLSISFSSDGKSIVSGSDAQTDEENLIVRPTHIDYMVSDICQIINRNFTNDEWKIYVGEDLGYEKTCDSKDLRIKVEEKKGN